MKWRKKYSAKSGILADIAAYYHKGVLFVADLHLGLTGNEKELLQNLLRVIEKTNCDTVVINGDLKHRFGYGFKMIENFVRGLEKYVKLVILFGNHDGGLRNLLKIDRYFTDGEILALHGHIRYRDLPEADVMLLAHSHPAYFVEDYVGGHKIRVWLESEIEDEVEKIGKCKRVIIMPSFNELCTSTAVNLEKPAGFIFKYVKEFEVFSIDGIYLGSMKF